MSDENSQSTGTAGDGSTRSEARGDHADRSGESWIDRLRAVVGWKTSSAALRENLEEALEQDAQIGRAHV